MPTLWEEAAYYAVVLALAGAVIVPLAGRNYLGLRVVASLIFAALVVVLDANRIDVGHWEGRTIYGALGAIGLLAAIAGLALASSASLRVWFSIGAFMLLLETGFRVFPIYDPLAVNPGIRYFWADWLGPLNNFGHRDRDFVTPKPADTFRIVLLGDSFTEGAGLSREQTFGRLLQRQLGPNVEVYNLGHSGMTTREEADVLLRDGSKLGPDLIILGYVFNDAETHPLERPYRDLPAWYVSAQRTLTQRLGSYASYAVLGEVQKLLPGNFASMDAFYASQHDRGGRGWANVTQGLSDIGRWAKDNHVEIIGAIWPFFFDEWRSDGNGLVGQVAGAMREHGFRVLDLSPVFAQRGPFGTLGISSHDAHPNAEANEIAARVLAKEVQKLRTP
jgi:lysophospholipase L1-like esterase